MQHSLVIRTETHSSTQGSLVPALDKPLKPGKEPQWHYHVTLLFCCKQHHTYLKWGEAQLNIGLVHP